MTDYNGWKNKETWLVNLWLGWALETRQEDGDKITAETIQEYVEEIIFDDVADDRGFLRDMLNCAMGEIDYRELAAHYQDTLEGEDD